MGITAFGINMLNFAILNLLIWFVGVGVTVYFLYYEDADRPIRRITECEVLVLCMSVCETLGVLLLHCFLQICGISNIDVVMQYCLEVTFSKLIMIFLYYVLINRLIKRTEAACSREQYIIYGILFSYSLVNMLVIVQNFRDGQKSYPGRNCNGSWSSPCRRGYRSLPLMKGTWLPDYRPMNLFL